MSELKPENGIYEALRDFPALKAIINGRVFPAIAPAGVAAPYVVLSQVEERSQASKDGPIPAGWGFQVACVAADNATARAASRAAKKALNWVTITTPEGAIRCRATDEINADWDDDQQYFQIVQDYTARRVRLT